MSSSPISNTDVGDSHEDNPTDESLPKKPPAEPDHKQLSLDEVFEVLKNRRRRHVIKYLQEIDEDQVSLSELAEYIAAKENDKSVKALTSSERKRVYVGLYQCHLPKMDSMDIVNFNQNRGLIELGPNVERLEPYIERTDTNDQIEWHRYYLVLSLVGIAALGMLQLWFSAFAISTLLVLIAFTGGLLGLSACHCLDRYRKLPSLFA